MGYVRVTRKSRLIDPYNDGAQSRFAEYRSPRDMPSYHGGGNKTPSNRNAKPPGSPRTSSTSPRARAFLAQASASAFFLSSSSFRAATIAASSASRWSRAAWPSPPVHILFRKEINQNKRQAWRRKTRKNQHRRNAKNKHGADGGNMVARGTGAYTPAPVSKMCITPYEDTSSN